MFVQAESLSDGAELRADVCIVGAGAAGITLARELARNHDVVVLESGRLEADAEAQALTEGDTSGSPQFPLERSRVRRFGGSTQHWTGMCRPLDPIDFETREWVPSSGWPLERGELDAWYAAARGICELPSDDFGASTWGDQATVSDELAAEGLVAKLVQYSPPTRFGVRYAAELRDSQRVRVVLGATVREVVPTPEVRSVDRVEAEGPGGRRFAVRARTTVLACGGIENARLLLLSNSVAADGVGNDRDLVGRYFMDHPAVQPLGLMVFLDPRLARFGAVQQVDGHSVQTGLAFDDAVQREHRLLHNALYTTRPVTPQQLAQGPVLGVRNLMGAFDLETIAFLERLFEVESARVAACWIRAEQAPNPGSRVRLSDARDRLGQRRTHLEWQLTDLDRASFEGSARLYAEALARSGAGRLRVRTWLLTTTPDWWQRVRAGWHHMGTTRMAAGPQHGVVDADCRVFGLEDLYVAGSSVFPTGGYANPTLTIVALALRLAQHLKSRLD